MRLWMVLGALGLIFSARVAYISFTVQIPRETLLVRIGTDQVVHDFAKPARIWTWDTRLAGTEQVPYWKWRYSVERRLNARRYIVMFEIMGTPEEGLRYRPKSAAQWKRPQLEHWSRSMLGEFEAQTLEEWEEFPEDWADEHHDEFRDRLTNWFDESPWSGQGIRIAGVYPNVVR